MRWRSGSSTNGACFATCWPTCWTTFMVILQSWSLSWSKRWSTCKTHHLSCITTQRNNEWKGFKLYRFAKFLIHTSAKMNAPKRHFMKSVVITNLFEQFLFTVQLHVSASSKKNHFISWELCKTCCAAGHAAGMQRSLELQRSMDHLNWSLTVPSLPWEVGCNFLKAA